MKKLIAILSASFLLTACNDNNEKITAGNEVIIAWNNLAVTIAEQHDKFHSFTGVRALTMVHVAMHDVLNAISLEYTPYAFNAKKPDADAVAACNQAAFAVLNVLYPTRTDTLEKEYQKWLATVPESEAKKSGMDLGQRSAEAILDFRRSDGYEANAPYTPRKGAGAYQFTPGVDAVWNPDTKLNKAWTIQKPDQFRVAPPPALTSEEYARDFNEVKLYGGVTSTARTKDQNNYGHWWAEFAEHGWNRVARLTAAQKKLPIHETARLFALINMAMYDYYLASVESKYHYDTWRPVTAIHRADIDDNQATTPDTSWRPGMITPPLPEYPSGHSGAGAVGATIMGSIFGTKEISFEMESMTALPDAKIRSYKNLDSAANDCARSRIMNGFHFRFSTVAGKEQGRKVAEYVLAHVMRPVAEQ